MAIPDEYLWLLVDSRPCASGTTMQQESLLTLPEAAQSLQVPRHQLFVWLRNAAFLEVRLADGRHMLCLRETLIDRLFTLKRAGITITTARAMSCVREPYA